MIMFMPDLLLIIECVLVPVAICSIPPKSLYGCTLETQLTHRAKVYK